jgi:hypothetical protein
MTTFDPARTAELAARIRTGRHAAPPIPVDFAPGRPPAERIARLLLSRSHPDLQYAAVSPEAVLAALGRSHPGHRLPEVATERLRLLEAETARVALVLGYVTEAVGLAEVALGEAS